MSITKLSPLSRLPARRSRPDGGVESEHAAGRDRETSLAVRPSLSACTWRVVDVSGGRKKLLSHATHCPAGSTMAPLVGAVPVLADDRGDRLPSRRVDDLDGVEVRRRIDRPGHSRSRRRAR